MTANGAALYVTGLISVSGLRLSSRKFVLVIRKEILWLIRTIRNTCYTGREKIVLYPFGQLPTKHVDKVEAKINNLLSLHKHKCYSVAFDYDKKFAGHETIIAPELEVDIYSRIPIIPGSGN